MTPSVLAAKAYAEKKQHHGQQNLQNQTPYRLYLKGETGDD